MVRDPFLKIEFHFTAVEVKTSSKLISLIMEHAGTFKSPRSSGTIDQYVGRNTCVLHVHV